MVESNTALIREKVLMDLWAGRPVLPSDQSVQTILDDLDVSGFISGTESQYSFSDDGLQYFINGRDTSEMLELLADINLSEEEKIFLANSIKTIVDKPFAYDIIKRATENHEREFYPSIDLGSFDDLEHGVLFCAKNHIMVDPQIDYESVLQKLEDYGAKITEAVIQDNILTVHYDIGGTTRELDLVRATAMEKNPFLNDKVKDGISSLMMKGKGGRGKAEFGDLSEVVEHYASFLRNGGMLLTGLPLKKEMEKIGEGMLAYWVHSSEDYRVSLHNLYLKTN